MVVAGSRPTVALPGREPVVGRVIRGRDQVVVDEQRVVAPQVVEVTAPTGDDHRVAEQQGVGDVEPPPLGSGEREEAVSARVEGVNLARGHVAGYQLDRGHVAAAGEKRRERRPDRYLMPTGSFSREPTPGPDRFVVASSEPRVYNSERGKFRSRPF